MYVLLENLGAGAGELGHRLLDEAPSLTECNTRFLQIHFHEELPHGDQIIAALKSVPLSEHEKADVLEGTQTGAILYLRMARWAMGLAELADEIGCGDEHGHQLQIGSAY